MPLPGDLDYVGCREITKCHLIVWAHQSFVCHLNLPPLSVLPSPSRFSLPSSCSKFNLTETGYAYDFELTSSCSVYSSLFIRDNRQFPSRLAQTEQYSLSGERDQ